MISELEKKETEEETESEDDDDDDYDDDDEDEYAEDSDDGTVRFELVFIFNELDHFFSENPIFCLVFFRRHQRCVD